MASNYVGIEISNRTVSMIQKISGKYVTATERLPDNLIRDGQVTAPDVLVTLLKKMVSEKGISSKKCALVLPEATTFFRTISMSVITEQELKLNLPTEFRDFIGENADGYYYDYALLGMKNGEDGKPETMEIAAGATLKENAKSWAELLKKAGLTLKVAIPREMALINLLRKAAERGACAVGDFCIAEISDEGTYVSMVSNGVLKSSKNIDLGCRQIDEAIAEKLGTDLALAAGYRESGSKGVRDLPECKAVYEKIALEMLKAVNFYKYENQQSEVSKIMFFGAGAQLPQLIEEIVNYTSLSCTNAAELIGNDALKAENCISALGAIVE